MANHFALIGKGCPSSVWGYGILGSAGARLQYHRTNDDINQELDRWRFVEMILFLHGCPDITLEVPELREDEVEDNIPGRLRNDNNKLSILNGPIQLIDSSAGSIFDVDETE